MAVLTASMTLVQDAKQGDQVALIALAAVIADGRSVSDVACGGCYRLATKMTFPSSAVAGMPV